MLNEFVKQIDELLHGEITEYVNASSDIEYDLELDCPDICDITAELEEKEIIPCSIDDCDNFPISLRTIGDLYKYLIDYCNDKT